MEVLKDSWHHGVDECRLLTSPIYHLLHRWYCLPPFPCWEAFRCVSGRTVIWRMCERKAVGPGSPSADMCFPSRRRSSVVGLLLATVLLSLTGCSDFVDRDQTNVVPDAVAVLEPGHPVGQTFVARHGGLSGVEVWLTPQLGAQGEIHLHLRSEPGSTEDLRTSVLVLGKDSAPGFYRFSFPPLPDSHSRYYYAFLEMIGQGEVIVGAGPGEAYLDGALYRDHEPLDAQMAFRLVYDPRWLGVDLLKASLAGLGLLGVAALLYLVPGYALLVYLWRGALLPWPAQMGVAAGLSLAIYPLLFLWTDLVGLHLGALYAWIPTVGGVAALAWSYQRWWPRQGWEALRRWVRSDAFWPDLSFILVLALVFAVRLLVVRGLAAPMWGDSYQHTMIAQLLVDHRGLFDSWEPYASLQTFTYHFGFHSAVAVFHWLTGMSMPQATLWVGQILNGLAVLAIYPLVVKFGGNRWGGVIALLVAGLLLPMPMAYVNWGRYTQLAGQVILPTALIFSVSLFESTRRDWNLAVIVWILLGGLALTHYRVLIFYIIFVIAWVILSLRERGWRCILARVAQAGFGSAALFLPWFVHTFAGNITINFVRQLTIGVAQVSSSTRQYNAIGDITQFMSPIMWLLLTVSVAVGLWQHHRGTLIISFWWFLLLIATNPDWLYLPGVGSISNFALFIAIYIAAGMLIGNVVGEWIARWAQNYGRSVLTAMFVLAMGILGLRVRMGDVHVPQHALVTYPDLRAMEWIKENTPRDARFLINSFFAYGGSVVVGADAGWWLPLLGGRGNTVPPLNYGSEQGPFPGYRVWINELTVLIWEKGIDHPDTIIELQKRGITHVYIGQQQGGVNYQGPDRLNPRVLQASNHYQVIYHRDRVWVFKVRWHELR